MSDLVELLKLQKALREAVVKLASTTDHEDVKVLRMQVEILKTCVNLDREISLLTESMLVFEETAGAA